VRETTSREGKKRACHFLTNIPRKREASHGDRVAINCHPPRKGRKKETKTLDHVPRSKTPRATMETAFFPNLETRRRRRVGVGSVCEISPRFARGKEKGFFAADEQKKATRAMRKKGKKERRRPCSGVVIRRRENHHFLYLTPKGQRDCVVFQLLKEQSVRAGGEEGRKRSSKDATFGTCRLEKKGSMIEVLCPTGYRKNNKGFSLKKKGGEDPWWWRASLPVGPMRCTPKERKSIHSAFLTLGGKEGVRLFQQPRTGKGEMEKEVRTTAKVRLTTAGLEKKGVFFTILSFP